MINFIEAEQKWQIPRSSEINARKKRKALDGATSKNAGSWCAVSQLDDVYLLGRQSKRIMLHDKLFSG